MSYVIKAFCEIDEALDTVMGNTSGVGELSPYSRTFSTHKTELGRPAFPHVSMTVFSCEQDEVDAAIPPNADTHMLEVLETIVSEFVGTISFQNQFESRFPSIAPTLYFDAITLYQEIELPGFIQWKATVDGEIIIFKIWTSDVQFRNSYDEYEIRVVPPVPNVGDLLQDRDVVLSALNSYTEMGKFSAIEVAKDSDPETKLVPLTLRWVDQTNGSILNLTWYLVCYGPKALLYENQIEAIRDYLRDKSGKVPDEWVDIIPELDVSTILDIIPLWHKVALRATGSIHYYHSITLQHHEFAEIQRLRLGRHADDITLSRTYFAATPYKGIGFMATPDPRVPMEISFKSLYPDYALIHINDINLNRLKIQTRDAIKAIERGIRMAEVYEHGMNLTDQFHIQSEGDLVYVCTNTNGVTLRVVSRLSFITAYNSL